MLSGNIEGLEPGGQPEMAWTFAGQPRREAVSGPGETPFGQALARLRELLAGLEGAPPITAVAHRVVHGGEDFRDSVLVTDAVLERLARLNSLAPLHQPHNLAGIRSFRQAFPALPQVACFDTAFHRTIPEVAQVFALPIEAGRFADRAREQRSLTLEQEQQRLESLVDERTAALTELSMPPEMATTSPRLCSCLPVISRMRLAI